MRSLLLKEWTLYHVFFVVIFGLMLWVSGSVLLTVGPISPILFAVPFVWLVPVSMTVFEFKNDSDVLINSLPVTRREVVLSKYVILILFSMASTGILSVIHILLQGVLPVAFFPKTPVEALILTYTGIGTFLSAYLPFYFVAGPRFMLFASMVMFFLGFIGLMKIGPHVMDIYSYVTDLWQRSAPLWSGVLLTVTTVLLFVSWLIATRIYEAKNL